MTSTKIVIFSDVDGTLIDAKYSYATSLPAISEILKKQVPFVLCSSKSRAEIEFYREHLGIRDPFISENGAAIYIPKNYFEFEFEYSKQKMDYFVVEFGVDYLEIRRRIKAIERKAGFRITGFGDMTVEEVAEGTGLPFELAKLAKTREYSEPCMVEVKYQEEFSRLVSQEGLRYEKGKKYFNLIGNHDKGKAVSTLKSLYEKEFGVVKSFAVGNDQNDFSMLKISDYSFFVDKEQNLGEVWTQVNRNLSLQSSDEEIV